MTDQQKLERRIAFARFEGYEWYQVELMYYSEEHGSYPVLFRQLIRPELAAMDAIKASGKEPVYIGNMPNYDTSAAARERLMEKALKEGYFVDFSAGLNAKGDMIDCWVYVEKSKRWHSVGNTLAEAFLSALYAAIQVQGEPPKEDA